MGARTREYAVGFGTILVVEDEQSIGSLVRTYLAREGFEVVWVRSGEPFSPRELAGRVKAVLRRAEPRARADVLTLGPVSVSRASREARVHGRDVELTAKEFDLLCHMVENAGVVSREALLDRVGGMAYPGDTRTVDVHVGQLRRKLGDPDLIRTVRGAGYEAVAPSA